ncbi:MAG: SsrA-binding protein SmpB [Thermogutta sp.]
MAKGKKAVDPANNNERVVTHNRRAKHQYDVLDTLECGVALVGSEVKSLRNGKVSIEEAFARVKDGEVWLYNCDIPEYPQANRFNHEPKRPRKLLLHRREIHRFAAQASQKGLTLIPLKIYFKRGLAKVLLGLCRGRKEHDKREIMKREESQREIRQMVHRYQNR